MKLVNTKYSLFNTIYFIDFINISIGLNIFVCYEIAIDFKSKVDYILLIIAIYYCFRIIHYAFSGFCKSTGIFHGKFWTWLSGY